jgi:hypothetical protein
MDLKEFYNFGPSIRRCFGAGVGRRRRRRLKFWRLETKKTENFDKFNKILTVWNKKTENFEKFNKILTVWNKKMVKFWQI